jgi:hypothetical protein
VIQNDPQGIAAERVCTGEHDCVCRACVPGTVGTISIERGRAAGYRNRGLGMELPNPQVFNDALYADAYAEGWAKRHAEIGGAL